VVTALPQPIPLALSEPGGALVSTASVDEIPIPFPVVIDTGSPITAYHKITGTSDAGVSYGHMGFFRLYAAGTPGPPRLEIQNIQLFETELRSVGTGAGYPVGGVMGGDNLGRFAVELDYRGAQPSMTLTETLLPCSCELADQCQSVFPFQLLGGQETIALGTNFYTYPATRVVLDACLEPLPDPVSEGIRCAEHDLASTETLAANQRYQPHGVDVKLLVSTGFPGLALGAGVYDRLRGDGAAEAALATPTRLHLPDVDDDGPDAEGLAVGVGSLGQSGLSALALVSRELYLGPCAELARSRRMRRDPPNESRPVTLEPDDGGDEAQCLETTSQTGVPPQLLPCGDIPNQPPACDDTTPQAHVASIIELTQPLNIYIVDDAAPLMQSVNADIRPGAATVEGVLGTEVLARLVSAIDYPHSRFIARCASDADCIGYPRYIQASEQSDCEDPNACISPSVIPLADNADAGVKAGGRCLAAP
jgi:hypothetical protein